MTEVYPYVIVEEGAVVGEGSRIQSFTFVEAGAVIGARVTVKPHNAIYNGVVLEDDVFVGSGVQFTNDRYPRSNRQTRPIVTRVGRGASLGAGAVILPGVTIGEGAIVCAGAVVTQDVQPNEIVVGNPARRARYLAGQSLTREEPDPALAMPTPTRVSS